MRIASIETFPVGLPFRERYVTASGSLERREMLILRLTADDGTTGHGDAVPLSLRGGPSLAAIRDDLEAGCRVVLESATLDVDRSPVEAGSTIGPILDACAAAGAAAGALAAVDIALLDLLARSQGVPAWVLLGAAAAEPVACNGTLGGGGADEVAATAAELAGAGFGTLKVKVGTGDDVGRLEAVRAACGDDVALRVDANGAWDVEAAARTLAALAEVELELAEQPCAALAELAEVRRRCGVAVVADESVSTSAEAARAIELDACDAVTLKLAKVGGPHAALRLAAEIPAYLSSALDSPLGIAAAVHAAQALPASGFAAGLAHGLATAGLFADNVADDGDLRGPTITPSSEPGLGVELDAAALERLRIPVGR